MHRIHVVTPIVTKGVRTPEDFAVFRTATVEISQELIDIGPASIESEYDEAMAIPDTLRKCVLAEKGGADAIMIDCFADPGMKAARELLSIPVLGPGESAMHLAAMLGRRFSVINVLDSATPMIMNNALIYGVADKLASVRVINTPVLELEADREAMFDALGRKAVTAVREDGAQVIVLGCTGMAGCAETVAGIVTQAFGTYIPVIDPVAAAIEMAKSLLQMGVSHSKVAYAMPASKPITGYETGR